MVTTKLNVSMTEPQVRQIYAKQGDTGRVLDITLDQTPEDGTLRILRPDGVEVTSEAVTGGEVSESGETVTFESMTEADVTELTVGIEPVQDLSHGDPSPTNICPITGHDEVTVTRTGKNLLPNIQTGSVTYNGITYTVNDDKSITVRGTATALSYFTISATNLNIYRTPLFKANIPIYTKVRRGLHTRYTDGTYGWIQPNVPYSPPKDISLVYIQYTSGETVDETVYPMVTYASETDDSYEPYQGSTYTTSLGQTVYGGTLDMVSGVLTVDRVMVTCDGSADENWVVGGWSSGSRYLLILSVPTSGVPNGVVFNYLYTLQGLSEQGLWGGKLYSTDRVDTYFPSDIANVSTLRDYLSQNNLQICYKVATPTTYQLTPQQIKTLVGTNNVWASSGDIISITFTYGGLLSELPSEATEIVGKCYCDVEQNGVSSMPFTLNVKKNERES